MGFEQQIDQWHEYYLAVAGAAAVLLGLVFIALSLHLEKAETPGVLVLGLGGQALINLIYGGGRRGRHRPPAIRPVPTGRRERGADRQRNSEHLGPAGVGSHPRP